MHQIAVGDEALLQNAPSMPQIPAREESPSELKKVRFTVYEGRNLQTLRQMREEKWKMINDLTSGVRPAPQQRR